MLEGTFQFDVFFDSGSSKQTLDGKNAIYQLKHCLHHSLASVLENGIAMFKRTFEARFDQLFPITTPFNESYLPFSRDISSNLLGGVGYFYGDSVVDNAFVEEWDRDEEYDDESTTYNPNPKVVPPRGLLTATPSRSFFPRGFYWCVSPWRRFCLLTQRFRDEGFHLLQIGEWDNDLRSVPWVFQSSLC
jgi:mannosyl-oligosaccharide glucosidase